MKRVSVSRRNPPPPGLPPNRATSTIASQVIPVATAMATSDVTGNTHRVPDRASAEDERPTKRTRELFGYFCSGQNESPI
jgi:lipase chaperone LimK